MVAGPRRSSSRRGGAVMRDQRHVAIRNLASTARPAELANQIQFTRPLAAWNRGRAQVRPPSPAPGVRPSACPRGPAASLLRVWLPRTPGPRRRLPSCGACNYPGPAAAAAQVRRLRLPRVGGCGCPGPAAAATSPAAGRFPAGQAVSEHPGSASGPLRGPSSGPQRRGDHVTTDHLNGSRNGAHSSGVSARAVVQCSVLDMKIFGRKA
jgi:hypothetical protein